MKKIDLLITGVGGQGVILASDIISEVALSAGYDIKKTDTLGMAQRGGSVVSHVRIAEKVWSPLAKEGEVDIILAFEKLEGVRWGSYLRPGGIAILNNQAIPPLAVSLGRERYPTDEEIKNFLKRQTDNIYFLDGTELAKELGNVRTLNILMLGCISRFIPIKVNIWKENVSKHVPARFRQVNLAAFDKGRKETKEAHYG